MADIFDYVYWRGDLPFEYRAVNDVDAMILARLSYLPFDEILNRGTDTAPALSDAAAAILRRGDSAGTELRPEDARLLAALADSVRFRDMRLSGCVSRFDPVTQTQFAALAVSVSDGMLYVSFRGTDCSLVGLKEDFNMSFECPVPAQELALEYIQDIAAGTEDCLILGGYSKGGNIAVYAASFCGEDIQRRITAIYNFDGPGFDDRVLRCREYEAICGRIRTFVPQSSVVGMMLGHEEEYTIVHSSRSGGIMQHDLYSWDVLKDGFVCLEKVDRSSRFIDYTLKAWINDLDYTQREKFVDTIYDILMQTHAGTLQDLREKRLGNAVCVLNSVRKLDAGTRAAVIYALKLLVKSAGSGLVQVLRDYQSAGV